MTLHRISTKALLEALPENWFAGTYHSKLMPKRAIGDVIFDLLQSRGGYFSVAELIDYIYGDAEDGGPLWAEDNVRLHIYRLRRNGHVIHTHGWRGYSVDKAA